ncbi:MAG: adenylosuccinate lyase, partial [Acidobacteria bacterium]|nr:adenylosuccinate lyase [Acidobacteriota bacterium]
MIPRYTLPEMGRVWSEENKFQKWLQVEIAVCEVLAEMGEIPQKELSQIQRKAGFSIDRIKEIEKVTRHDMIAFTTAVAEKVGPASRFIHFGLTSTDVVDTAQALQIKEASELIEKELLGLLSTLKAQALRYKQVPAIGRTHGIHAEPVTLGLKLAVWYSEMERNLQRFRRARETLEVGKISGPVGSFSHLPPQVEEKVCQKLEIDFARVSTQTLQRDRHAEYLCTLAILGSTYDKVATEIRHLMRTEVQEVSEPFGSGQKGSSAMPHKRNPVTCENISGLSRLMRSNAQAALENIPLWHERDISHSSVENAESLNLSGMIGLKSWPAFNNSGDATILKNNRGIVVDKVEYSASWHSDAEKMEGGWSLERINLFHPCSQRTNWSSSIHNLGGTPGWKNSIDDPSPDTSLLRVDRIVPLSRSELELTLNNSI